jgi:hypothetical protein
MILRIPLLLATASLINNAAAAVAPEITWIQDGYNFIAKLPCRQCPFLYQDTSQGERQPWSERKDNNALVKLNLFLVQLILTILASKYKPTI